MRCSLSNGKGDNPGTILFAPVVTWKRFKCGDSRGSPDSHSNLVISIKQSRLRDAVMPILREHMKAVLSGSPQLALRKNGRKPRYNFSMHIELKNLASCCLEASESV
jgi:hypothetical protein